MKTPRFLLLLFIGLLLSEVAYCWGFFGHRKINRQAVFLLPPEMISLFKNNIDFLEEHSTDPDKRRYAVVDEGPRHYIDIDHYGEYPFPLLPRGWCDAIDLYTEDTLVAHGIAPWHLQVMLRRLTTSFQHKDLSAILKNSAEIGHYLSDIHVPLHTSSNHNGQLTNQRGIHAFWESRVPELLCDESFDFFIGKASYLTKTDEFIWSVVMESARSVDSVLAMESALTLEWSDKSKYAFENRNGHLVKQYSSGFTKLYNSRLNGMVERRMRQAIWGVASFWFTAWVNAGQPDLNGLVATKPFFNVEAWKWLNHIWQNGKYMIGRQE
jgi:hypothetical protein